MVAMSFTSGISASRISAEELLLNVKRMARIGMYTLIAAQAFTVLAGFTVLFLLATVLVKLATIGLITMIFLMLRHSAIMTCDLFFLGANLSRNKNMISYSEYVATVNYLAILNKFSMGGDFSRYEN